MTSSSEWTNHMKDSFKNMQYQYRAPDFGLYTKKIHVINILEHILEHSTDSCNTSTCIKALYPNEKRNK